MPDELNIIPLERQERLKGVEPELAAFALRVPVRLGGRWRVVRGVTTDAEQALLYAKGRTVPGERVTDSRPMGSTVTEAANAHDTAHGVRAYGGCAIDFAAMNEDGTVDWTPPRYVELGAFAKGEGFEWGGDFKILRRGVLVAMADNGHVQVRNWRGIPLRLEVDHDV